MRVIQNPAPRDKNGDFIATTYTEVQQDAIGTYGVVRGVYTMYVQDLNLLAERFPRSKTIVAMKKTYEKRKYGVLEITPDDGVDENAYYNREGKKRELKFFHFEDPKTKETIKTCASSDVVAHEAGHSFLDILKPGYFDTTSAHTGGLHEAFGDLTALFWTLTHGSLCREVIVDTKGNLHKPNFVSSMAEQFGKAIGEEDDLRTADDDVDLRKTPKEVHDISRVFTGALYDILVDGFDAHYEVNGTTRTPETALFEASEHLRRLLLQSLIELNNDEPTFSDVAWAMYTTAQQRQTTETFALDTINWPQFIKAQFERRSVPVKANSKKLRKMFEGVKVEKKAICGVACKQHLKAEELRKKAEEDEKRSEPQKAQKKSKNKKKDAKVE
jgi:hypothetical protein